MIKPRETRRESPSRIGVCADYVSLDEIADAEPRSGREHAAKDVALECSCGAGAQRLEIR
jgi:hypothetical protein